MYTEWLRRKVSILEGDIIGHRDGKVHMEMCSNPYRSFATRMPQHKIWYFLDIGIERNICRCTINRYSVITQIAKLAAGEQLCRCCTHRKL
jgi:hypothetical protein